MKKYLLLIFLGLVLLLAVNSSAWMIMTSGVRTLGADLVTDGGFAAVTETNQYTSDFSAGTDGWIAAGGVIAGNIDIGGETDVLRLTVDGNNSGHRIWQVFAAIAPRGTCLRIRFKYYIPSGQSNIDGIRAYVGGYGITDIFTITDSWTAIDLYANTNPGAIENGALEFYAHDGAITTFQDVGADDVFYVKDIIVDVITFTNWTAGTGWAPQVTVGALTGKALKTAGTASALEQDVGAIANTPYNIIWTNDQSTSGKSINAEVGGVNGATITSDATTNEDISATTTGNLKIEAAADWAGTVDDISAKRIY